MKKKKKSCDHKETLYSKGDVRRPEDTNKFAKNWDAIFGTKEKANNDRS